MKKQTFKNFKIGDYKVETNPDHLQDIFPVIGKLFSKEELISVFNNVIESDRVFQENDFGKEGDEQKINLLFNQALDTFYNVNMVAKSYLMYSISLLEAKTSTFFIKNILKILDVGNKTLVKDINDKIWSKIFSSKSKFNDFKHKFTIWNKEVEIINFFKEMTLGNYIFILTRLNDNLIKDFFTVSKIPSTNVVFKKMKQTPERSINSLKLSLKIAKEWRNAIIHETIIIDPLLLQRIADKVRPEIPLATTYEKMDYLFDAINLCLTDIGYTQLKFRLSRHIDREISEKNKKQHRNNKDVKLSLKYIDLFNFYQKKEKK